MHGTILGTVGLTLWLAFELSLAAIGLCALACALDYPSVVPSVVPSVEPSVVPSVVPTVEPHNVVPSVVPSVERTHGVTELVVEQIQLLPIAI